jgi:hypothetical protein
MYSVSQRVKMIKQPKNGYLDPLDMECVELEHGELHVSENLPGYIVGLVVDYLSRYCFNHDVDKAFEISLLGAKVANKEKEAKQLLNDINEELDDKCIKSACELVIYDSYLRGNVNGVDNIIPNDETINNIRIMVKRSIKFFDNYGPISKDGFTFKDGYTKIISSGDGDFLTHDTLWDFKVLRNEPNTSHTLQLLIYYFMGKNSNDRIFDGIENVGIFNPRLNKVYTYNVNNLDKNIKNEILTKVIGYKKRKTR